jgi:hypothetical protein
MKISLIVQISVMTLFVAVTAPPVALAESPDPYNIVSAGQLPGGLPASSGDDEIWVYPEGGDDTGNLQWALEHVATNGVVQLQEGDYYLSNYVEVFNFNGTFKGVGTAEFDADSRIATNPHSTRLRTVPGITFPVWTWDYPDECGRDFIEDTGLIFFNYDSLAPNTLVISDLSVYSNTPTEMWLHHCQPVNWMRQGIGVYGDSRLRSLHRSALTLLVERYESFGDFDPGVFVGVGSWSGHSLAYGFVVAGDFVTSVTEFRNSYFHGHVSGVGAWSLENAELTAGGATSYMNRFHDLPAQGIDSGWLRDSNVMVSHNQFEDVFGATVFHRGVRSTLAFYGNSVTNPAWAAWMFSLWDSSVVVSDNEISGEGFAAVRAIDLLGSTLEVADNSILGLSGAFIRQWPWVYAPSTYYLHDNAIEQRPDADYAGFEIWDFSNQEDARSGFTIVRNSIHSDGAAFWGPIFTAGTRGATITDNLITGSGPAAMYLGSGSIWGADDRYMHVANNDVLGFTPKMHRQLAGEVIPSHYWLGSLTSDNSIIGQDEASDRVFDTGLGNTVLNAIHIQQGQPDDPPGQSVFDGTMGSKGGVEDNWLPD